MSTIHETSQESIIDRAREQLIAKVVAGTAGPKERATIEELSSTRATLMKRRLIQRSQRKTRYLEKKVG